MTLLELLFATTTCFLVTTNNSSCQLPTPSLPPDASQAPQHTGQAVDVVLSAASALAWDINSGKIIYSKQAGEPRPVASLIKLASLLYAEHKLAPDTIVTIPPDAAIAARSGANVRLPVGEHVRADQLIAAGAIASANDAVVSLGVAIAGSEEQFVRELNVYIASIGAVHTKAANATGLSGGDQYSTAEDVRLLLTRAAKTPLLLSYLQQPAGTLHTQEGSQRAYRTTNQLLATYLPIVAAKTGYTVEAGENLAIITTGPAGQQVGAVILGSTQRFQDMKILIEWIWRNYSWQNK